MLGRLIIILSLLTYTSHAYLPCSRSCPTIGCFTSSETCVQCEMNTFNNDSVSNVSSCQACSGGEVALSTGSSICQASIQIDPSSIVSGLVGSLGLSSNNFGTLILGGFAIIAVIAVVASIFFLLCTGCMTCTAWLCYRVLHSETPQYTRVQPVQETRVSELNKNSPITPVEHIVAHIFQKITLTNPHNMVDNFYV